MPKPDTPSQASIPDVEKCRQRALLLLGQRPHSICQLRRKLAAKGFAATAVEEIVEDFTRLTLLDDRRLAYDYCAYMKSASPPASRWRVAAKLKNAGVDGELIAEALAEVWDAGGEDEEVGRAVGAAQTKLRLLRPGLEPRSVREKIYRFLAGKGFSADVCRLAVEQALAPEDRP